MSHPATIRGFSLLEALVYAAVTTIIVGAALPAVYHSFKSTVQLQLASESVSRTLNAGERWRADIRAAVRSPEIRRVNDFAEFIIPQRDGDVLYATASNSVTRSINGITTVVLKNVKSSAIQPEGPRFAGAWRWEVELKSHRPTPRLRPLFTFKAVTGARE